jgi:mannose-1-phosphate guanylyltransferase
MMVEDNSSFSCKVVILIGGPSKGTRFRPLSLDVPKPLFPISGQPMIWHHIKACTKLPKLSEIFLIGFYEESKLKQFIQKTEEQFSLKIRYLQENGKLGTAGGLRKFRDVILAGNPTYFFVLHCDVICSFPLIDILEFHKRHGKECTILGKKVAAEVANRYGCLAIDENTKEMLHYAEKPETFVSDLINAGIYLFSPSIFHLMDEVTGRSHAMHSDVEADPSYLRLEQDLFMKVCGEQHVFVYETKEFWSQLKSAGMAIQCTESLLQRMRMTELTMLAIPGDGKIRPIIIGNVLIHPSAIVSPSAKLGPNVCIGSNVVIRDGVRVAHSIILDDSEVKKHACILYSIVGWRSVIGEWSRIEGLPNIDPSANSCKGGISILGTEVTVAPEIVIRSSTVLPHKELSSNSYNEIIL